MAKDCFEDVRKKDPYRLDNMDTYSNVLYVKVVGLVLQDMTCNGEQLQYGVLAFLRLPFLVCLRIC